MRAYTALFIVLAYIFTCKFAQTWAQEFKPAELSRPALIFHPIKCTVGASTWNLSMITTQEPCHRNALIKCLSEGHAQPTDIYTMVIYRCIRAYLHTYNSQRICAARYCPAWQCVTFPIDRGPDLVKNWVRLCKLSNLVARWSMVISCVLLYDSITSLLVYTVGLRWIILTLDRWSYRLWLLQTLFPTHWHGTTVACNNPPGHTFESP